MGSGGPKDSGKMRMMGRTIRSSRRKTWRRQVVLRCVLIIIILIIILIIIIIVVVVIVVLILLHLLLIPLSDFPGSAESDESDSAMDQTLLEAVAQMPAKGEVGFASRVWAQECKYSRWCAREPD